MENPEKLDDIIKEAEWKFGRNMLIFQRIECIIKKILPILEISTSLSDLKNPLQDSKSKFHKLTLGPAAGEFSEKIFSDSDDYTSGHESHIEPIISTKIYIKSNQKRIDEFKQSTARLVVQRNELTHHFLEKWDFDSVEGGKATIEYLDSLYEEIKPKAERYKSIAKFIHETITECKDVFESDDFQSALEVSVQWDIPIICLIGEIALTYARDDGWCSLDLAEQLIQQHVPNELDELRKQYKCQSLKKLLKTTELFDIHEEPTSKGGFNVFYKIKPHINLDLYQANSETMKNLTIDRQDLILALTSNFDLDEGAHYLDTETGELILFSKEFQLDPSYGIPDDIEDNPRYLLIEPLKSYQTFPIMEDFIDTLEPGKMVNRLTKILTEKKPFRHFKDALYDYPDLPDQWFQFQDTALTEMASDWCQDHNIKVEWAKNTQTKPT